MNRVFPMVFVALLAMGPALMGAGSAHADVAPRADATSEAAALAARRRARAERHLSMGRAYLAAGDTGSAIAYFGDAIRADPSHAAAYHALGRAHLARGEHGEAVRALRLGLRRSPGDAGLALALAQAEAEGGSLTRALEALRVAARRNPTHGRLHLARADYAQRAGAWAEATDAYARVLDLAAAGVAISDEDVTRARRMLGALRLVAGSNHPRLRACSDADTAMARAIAGCDD